MKSESPGTRREFTDFLILVFTIRPFPIRHLSSPGAEMETMRKTFRSGSVTIVKKMRPFKPPAGFEPHVWAEMTQKERQQILQREYRKRKKILNGSELNKQPKQSKPPDLTNEDLEKMTPIERKRTKNRLYRQQGEPFKRHKLSDRIIKLLKPIDGYTIDQLAEMSSKEREYIRNRKKREIKKESNIVKQSNPDETVEKHVIKKMKGRPLKPIQGYEEVWTTMTPNERQNVRKKFLKRARVQVPRKRIIKDDVFVPVSGYAVSVWRQLTKKERLSIRLRFKYETDMFYRRFHTMHSSTRIRNKRRAKSGKELLQPVPFDEHEFKEWLINQGEYFKVTNEWRFKMTMDHGCYDSLSCDRLDNDKGYSFGNIVPRPWCLNTPFAFTREQLEQSRRMLLAPLFVDDFADLLFNAFDSFTGGSKSRPLRGREIEDMRTHLKMLYIEQGGRCAYSVFPMELARDTPNKSYLVSVERLNPRLPYQIDNVVLICRGFNFGVRGGHVHGKECDEDYLMNRGVWNQTYWNDSMAMTHDLIEQLSVERARFRSEMLAAFPLWAPPIPLPENVQRAILGYKT